MKMGMLTLWEETRTFMTIFLMTRLKSSERSVAYDEYWAEVLI